MIECKNCRFWETKNDLTGHCKKKIKMMDYNRVTASTYSCRYAKGPITDEEKANWTKTPVHCFYSSHMDCTMFPLCTHCRSYTTNPTTHIETAYFRGGLHKRYLKEK